MNTIFKNNGQSISLDPINENERLYQMYERIPYEYKLDWMRNNPIIDDPFGTREPTVRDIKRIVTDWLTNNRETTTGSLDPLQRPIRNMDIQNNRHQRTNDLNVEMIKWLEDNHPIQESFLKNHCEMHKINALDGLVNCIKRLQEIGFQAEVKTAVSGINKELKKLEEEKNELHNRRSNEHQQRNGKNGERQKTDSFRSFDEDVPF